MLYSKVREPTHSDSNPRKPVPANNEAPGKSAFDGLFSIAYGRLHEHSRDQDDEGRDDTETQTV
jgi:hypothetical protein